ncbi:Concanavalin A-like lectins/glucanases protein [Dioscorea alata]|uniref:Concanavalin A-like lectins/glucanases protein n=1 Tax=Dioscorea alata TaxID=55571 RepID=A0ACB7WBA8_DIOAL|nr:Concanavalin A-like lectins/glucanases protein [Dioscorea alata]
MEVDPMGLVPLPSTSSSDDQAMLVDPSPSQLDTTALVPFVRVSTDKLTVSYTGSGTGEYDVGAVRADRPVPGGRMAYYFEMLVKNSGEKGCVAIGFGHENYNLRRQPGWDIDSCGYHGDDGRLFTAEGGYGKPFGPTFSTGDTVGAGINYASKEFFFTKNGKLVGNVRLDIKGPLYPLVALHSPNEEIYVNFGQQPLLFSFEAFMLEERLKQQALIQKSSLPPNACHRIIRSYLLHYGYQDTVDAFEKESEICCQPTTVEDEQDGYALNHRKILREHIKKGEIGLVFDKLREWYPQVVENETSAVCFLLHSQKFIGYVRDIFGLLAYSDPTTSCTWYQLGMCHPEFVADAVNVMVLSTNPNLKNPKNCAASRLEKLLRQVTVCSSENGDRAVFDLHPELWNGSKI